jgi:hypothetical protein
MDLTIEEKKQAIEREVTKCYPKMLADSLRITSYNHKQFEDLLPHVLSEFLTKKDIDYQYKVAVIDKKLLNYIGRSLSLNLRSSTSTFWNKYRKEAYNSRGTYIVEIDEFGKHPLDYIPEPDKRIEDMNPRECLFAAIDNLDFYFKALITEYYIHDLTLIEINEKYKIPINAIRKDLKQGVKLIQQHCTHWVPKELKP